MFKFFNAEQYRALDYDQLVERRDAVMAELDKSDCDVEAMAEEVKLCRSEFHHRETMAELRGLSVKAVADGEGKVIARSGAKGEEKVVADKFDTDEYKRAFFEYVTRGASIPAEFRAYPTTNDFTHTTDVPPQIPTTMGKEIIARMKERGTIWNMVRKLSVKGGLWFRTLDLAPKATWIDEDNPSKTQKFEDNDKVSFSFYMLECRVSQSLLTAAVTYDDFQSLFVPAIADAMVDALEAAIVSGDGDGKPLGITEDDRITNVAELSASDISDWKKWRTSVKAKIPKSYRNGQFIMSQSTWDTYIETFADDNNSPVSLGYNPVTGEEEYRLMGIKVITVEDDILPDFDTAGVGDVFAIYGRMNDYAVNIQPGMPMNVKRWIDDDENKEKLKALTAVDGKVLDPHGFMLIKKGAVKA